jgi:hypothetical protein
MASGDPKTTAPEPDYRDVLLKLIGSITSSEHIGDVGGNVQCALKMINIDIEWDEWDELRRALAAMGVTTLFGTPLAYPEDDDDE